MIMRKAVFLILFLFVPLYLFAANKVYTVQKGDTLQKLSKRFNVSVKELTKWNNLRSYKLSVGQKLIVSMKQEIPIHSEDYERYTIKKGDTIESIADKFDVEPEEIVRLNGLKSSKLIPGKSILIPSYDVYKQKDEEIVDLPSGKPIGKWKDSNDRDLVVKVAKSFIGAPYKFGGESVRGLDCSAFVKKVYEIFDLQLPRSAREQFRVGMNVSKDELLPGDLVFFKTRRHASYPTHVGIYIGEGKFIHASSQNRTGVKIDTLSSDFFSRTYVGARRIMEVEERNEAKKETNENSQRL